MYWPSSERFGCHSVTPGRATGLNGNAFPEVSTVKVTVASDLYGPRRTPCIFQLDQVTVSPGEVTVTFRTFGLLPNQFQGAWAQPTVLPSRVNVLNLVKLERYPVVNVRGLVA